MTVNDLSPGFVRVFYASARGAHTQTLPIRFNTPPVIGADPELLLTGGGTSPASTAVNAYITVAKAVMPPTTAYTGWEIYSKEVGEDPVFLFGGDLTVLGTSATAINNDSQGVASFRTSVGGKLLFYFMDIGVAQVNTRTALRTTSSGFIGALATYVLGANCIVYGRDGGRGIAGLWWTTKTNDALRKRELINA